MSYVDRNLLPQEEILFRTRLHWIVYAMPGTLMLIGLVMLGATLFAHQRSFGESVGSLMLLAGFLVWFMRWLIVKTSEFAVTTKRVVIKVGVVRRYTLEMLYRQVEAIAVDQGMIGRIFGYGTVKIVGTGA